MGPTNIQDAKILISSSKVTERSAGLKDLVHILQHNRGRPSLEVLGNKAYLALCETLLQCLRDERATFLRSKVRTSKTAPLLPLAAKALRHVIYAGVRAIKSSTVEVIVSGILEVLPDKDGRLLSPLLEDLPKTLRALLDYQPHVERLSEDCWQEAVDFCLASLAAIFTEPDADEPASWSSGLSGRARTPQPSTDGGVRPSQRALSSKRAVVPNESVHAAEDLVTCLQLLVKASNSPVLDMAEPILKVCINFLQQKSARGKSAALGAINSILPRITLHNSRLTDQLVQDLLPLMKTMWSDLLLREEILIALTYTEAHAASVLAHSCDDAFSLELEALLDVVYNDYRRRQETTAHQYLEDDHLCFRHLGQAGDDTHPLTTCAFSMEPEHARYEGLWSTVAVIARMSFVLDERKRRQAHDQDDGDESMVKRLRITHHFQEYLRHVSEIRSNAKRAALQVLAFIVQEGPLGEEELRLLLEKLIPCISDENPAHSSWAMIALSAAAFQQNSKLNSLSFHWISVWKTASRVVTSSSSSRAACHLLDVLLKLSIVPFSAVSETVQTMLASIELNGPALLTDSTSALMTTLIREKFDENPTHYNQTAERVLNWLLSKWTPSQWPERTYATLNAHHCNASDVLRVLHACLDRPFVHLGLPPYRILGPIAQARMRTSEYRELSHYLLLLEDESHFTLQTSPVPNSTNASPANHATQLENRISDFCLSEVEKTTQRWKEWSQQHPQSITPDMLRIVTNLCVVGSALGSLLEHDYHKISDLERAVDGLSRSFVQLLAKAQTEQYKVDAVLEACVQNLPDIGRLKTLAKSAFGNAGILSLANHLPRALDTRKETKQSFYVDDDDFMEIDDGPSSQMTAGTPSMEVDIPRHDISASSDASAVYSCCSSYLHLVSYVSDMLDGEEDQIPSEFIEYISSIPEVELLRSRQFIQALLSTQFSISQGDSMRLLERLSDALIDPRAREYNTSEVANIMMVEVLIGTTEVWSRESTDREAEDLCDHVEALYAYYARGMEKNGVRRSPALQTRIAAFLHGLLRHHPEFGKNRKIPSARTSLFELLSEGEMSVKYQIAERLPDIFADFILSKHDEILQDVDGSLPGENSWLEGIAMRLLVLSKLASRWHTIQRQCIYRMFATAGSITIAAQHARLCISKVASAREMGDAKGLFRLFAPQILFTWLDRQRRFDEIPFVTFGYDTLADLLRDVEAEAVGQAMMLSRKDDVDYVSEQLGLRVPELLARNMAKAAAYTISFDTCIGSARNKASPSSCNLLRDLVGKDVYVEMHQKQYPQILGYILQTISLEERVSKQFDKKPPFHDASKALSEMTNISHSKLELDIGIEPAFSAYYLSDQLERLCRRTGEAYGSIWTSSTYTLVMRMLLDRIHPTLGSLYASSIIRKIRILVALAGPVAYSGYPLQMTLQSLRPFLTDIQCAEDVVGIMQYLFEHGVLYLRSHLSFVTGVGLSVLISIREFLGSSQESTTQQSQFLATINTATKFHGWFTKYLESYADSMSGNESRSAIKAFRLITMAASKVRIEGNSIQGSEESKLLLEILEDVRSGRKLLNNTSREVALDLLCQNFQPAPTARDDVLGSDFEAARYAPHVWDSCLRGKVGDGYLLWAARVLGRAFGAYGEVKRSTTHTRPWLIHNNSNKDSLGRSSREAIVKEITDVFYSDDRSEVSLAEEAIRLALSRLAYAQSSLKAELNEIIPESITKALDVSVIPDGESSLPPVTDSIELCAGLVDDKSASCWVRDLTISLCRVASHEPLLGALPKLLLGFSHVAERLFPYILHLALIGEFEGEHIVRQTISSAMKAWFTDCNARHAPHARILIQAMLYLRSRPFPREVTRVDRDRWLEIDYIQVARTACLCGMYRSALLFAETSGQPVAKVSRRSLSVLETPKKLPVDLQLSIFKNLDEPDSFYGVDRGYSLASVMDRVDYEGDGVKSLLFRGARLDSQIRRSNALEAGDSRGMVKSLIMLNMNTITHSLLSNDQFREMGDEAVENTLHTARKLGQWDIKAPETNHSEPSILFKAFQGLHYATDAISARSTFNQQFLATMESLSGRNTSSTSTKSRLRTLAVLTEADEVISCHPSNLLDVWDRMKGRESWMRAGEFEDVRQLLSCRETLFGVLGSNELLLESLRATTPTVRHMEVEALVSSSTICRKHGALQESLARVTYLADIVQQCKAVGFDIEAIAQHEIACVLWEQGEAETSTGMREHLIQYANFGSQGTDISLPVLLAKLGHHLAEARLKKPDVIIQDYLEPAIRELKGQTNGSGPGQVFHEFALFCDKQLQSPEALEDMERAKLGVERRLQEWQEFQKLSNSDKSKSMKDTYRRNAQRAKNWYNLDNAEYQRLLQGREIFLRQCLENYLLSLQASDEFNNDALRVFSLWLEYSDLPLANEAVRLYLHRVPSGKFALLMNQLSSRLQNEQTDFQQHLLSLVFRICKDHPYHGMHQIFAIQTKVGNYTKEDIVRSKDESARSRQKAAHNIAQLLDKDRSSQAIWRIIYAADEIYHALAMFKDERDRQGREIPLDRYQESRDLVNKVPGLRVPPPTMQIEVRANMDYSDLPKIAGFSSRMGIANGLSAPKVITAKGSDGKPYKILFKSGNDDMRQDAIMEQVFDQVSRLLKNHTATRLRNLGIRTYQVVPLSTRSGLMEFVQDTTPLHLWVMPAHERYYPNDIKPDQCRKQIGAVQQESMAKRVKTWQNIANNFHPVMRYFLLELFQDPDEWFEKRLAYTRSTAAISILGHVLGLGDRHCHNILLDKKSGEVVHIDLGVSFEAGRVLPVPEVVPFRLTRDLVDAMGYTKTEGVFRRCCEFTMDTLREERESIMTLLNVLRYDPLVNWSVNPTKAKRMQEGQDTNANGNGPGSRAGTAAPGGGTPAPSGLAHHMLPPDLEVQESNKKKEEQAGEAGRALAVVEKKLSKMLSTKATVNELIQTATDERNLAVLYQGWASYA
ncbi:hypothetical protein P280DRAFT_439907 [Massarina eburnea CBS 473.64]|uniref:Serine/threonine-protein kinase Tel1 n=1 Tax=Massarina eburnea CBS 473.64 TaxID=1395130 RepID=A0A6A6SFS6_9PLEO|nr:hypothetical protein P280DRAFT_439907 [Massarina eburnea CBS 473.64]